MSTGNDDKNSQEVRGSYGKVARLGTKASGVSHALSFCGEQEIWDTRNSRASCCGAPEFTPEKLSKAVGYIEAKKPE